MQKNYHIILDCYELASFLLLMDCLIARAYAARALRGAACGGPVERENNFSRR
jgi:hypothetical protein